MSECFVDSVLQNWRRHVVNGAMPPQSTFYAITVDEREAFQKLGFEVDNGWCTPPASYAAQMDGAQPGRQN